MPEYPCTLWHSSFGVGDGQDMASRGYLRALMEVGYEHVVVSPRGLPREFHFAAEYEDFRPIFGFPEKFVKKLKRVEPGDPRIGSKWEHLEPMTIPPPAHAPKKAATITWDAIVQEGEIDNDYYHDHPEELGTDWTPRNELIVLHYDPGQLARARDAIAIESGGEVPVVGITAWETSGVPPAIAQQLSDLDLLIVPSSHTARAFRGSGLDVDCPIKVVPHTLGFHPLTDAEATRASRAAHRQYRFYTIGTDIPRKNLRTLIAAFCHAFYPSFEQVKLIIKTSLDAARARKLIREGVELFGKPCNPSVVVFGEKWSDAQIRQLHDQGNCWVDANRGEGFGLGQVEAAAMGNPVITTGWGAAPEALDFPGVMVVKTEYTMRPVDDEMANIGPYRGDQLWADPEVNSIVDAMRTAAVERWPKSLSQARAVGERYSRRKIGETLARALEGAKD